MIAAVMSQPFESNFLWNFMRSYIISQIVECSKYYQCLSNNSLSSAWIYRSLEHGAGPGRSGKNYHFWNNNNTVTFLYSFQNKNNHLWKISNSVTHLNNFQNVHFWSISNQLHICTVFETMQICKTFIQMPPNSMIPKGANNFMPLELDHWTIG